MLGNDNVLGDDISFVNGDVDNCDFDSRNLEWNSLHGLIRHNKM